MIQKKVSLCLNFPKIAHTPSDFFKTYMGSEKKPKPYLEPTFPFFFKDVDPPPPLPSKIRIKLVLGQISNLRPDPPPYPMYSSYHPVLF